MAVAADALAEIKSLINIELQDRQHSSHTHHKGCKVWAPLWKANSHSFGQPHCYSGLNCTHFWQFIVHCCMASMASDVTSAFQQSTASIFSCVIPTGAAVEAQFVILLLLIHYGQQNPICSFICASTD